MKESIVGKFSSKSRERQPIAQLSGVPSQSQAQVLSDEIISSNLTHPNDSTFSFEQLKQSQLEIKISSKELEKT